MNLTRTAKLDVCHLSTHFSILQARVSFHMALKTAKFKSCFLISGGSQEFYMCSTII